VNYNEDEEATSMESVTMLQFSWFKSFVVVPILSLLTIGIFAICLYWKISLRAKWRYNRVQTISETGYCLVQGRDGTCEIKTITDFTSEVSFLSGVLTPSFVSILLIAGS